MFSFPATWQRRAVPAVWHFAGVSPAALAGRRLCGAGSDGALVDDLHAGAPVFSAPPAAAAGGQQTGNDEFLLFDSLHRAT